MSSLLVLVLLVLLLYNCHPASSMQIAIGAGPRKCFTEQVPRGATVYADFRASSSRNPLDIALLVTNEYGHIVAQKSPITHYKFTIVPPRQAAHSYRTQRNPLESYRFCLIPQPARNHAPSVENRVSFSIRIGDGGGGVGTKKVDLLKTSHVEQTNQKIRELDDSVSRLLFSMDTLRKQEDVLSQQNAATSRHLVTVSSLTSIVVVAVGILQFDAVKDVLRKRKVIP